MSVYSLVAALHVVVAILGVGPLAALTLMTRRPPLTPGGARPLPPEAALRAFLRLLRLSQVSLGVMLATGAALIALVHGAYGHQRWMMLSVALFLLLGAGTGLVQRQLKRALAVADVLPVEQAHRMLVALCVLVVLIAWLMEAKPF
jgi:hypothetical protein